MPKKFPSYLADFLADREEDPLFFAPIEKPDTHRELIINLQLLGEQIFAIETPIIANWKRSPKRLYFNLNLFKFRTLTPYNAQWLTEVFIYQKGAWDVSIDDTLGNYAGLKRKILARPWGGLRGLLWLRGYHLVWSGKTPTVHTETVTIPALADQRTGRRSGPGSLQKLGVDEIYQFA